MAYGELKDLPKRTVTDKISRDKAFNVANGYQREIVSMFYTFFDKKVSGDPIENKIVSNHQLLEKLHKPVIRKFEKRNVYSSFKDNILGADLADMQLVNNFNKGICFLLCVIDMYSKYAWVVHLKDNKFITINTAFQKLLDEFNRKLKKIWVNKCSEVYNRSMKSWLQDNDI